MITGRALIALPEWTMIPVRACITPSGKRTRGVTPMMDARILCVAAMVALLAGCAAQPTPPPAAASAPPPTPAASATPGSPTPYDGVYKATSSNGIAKSRGAGGCNNSMTTLRITNGNAAMNWREPMRGPIGPDGSVNIGGPGSMLTGQITSGVFTGKLETPFCSYTVTRAR